MEKKLYIVSTYYHALISCVKQLNFAENADILVTDYIPEGRSLADRIIAARLFDRTYYSGQIIEYCARNKLDYIFNFHRKNAELIEKQLSVPFSDYREINVFHDDTWASHYLKDRKIEYRLLEDALDSFKNISKSCFAYMLPKNRIKAGIKKYLRIGYVFCGLDKYTKEVEVNEINGAEITSFAAGKLKEVPREPLFNALSDNDKSIIMQIFAEDIPKIQPEKSVLLLTQPLYLDGYVETEQEQLEIYRRFVSENLSGDEQLIIKPHPRDNADYSVLFPESVILEKNMPSEILVYVSSGCFSKAITLFSASINSIKAKNYIIYGGIYEL